MKSKNYIPRLKNDYIENVIPKLMKKFQYDNIFRVPKLKKIVVSQGIGKATTDKKLIDIVLQEMSLITGQKAIATYSKKDISNFKLRKGMAIGAKVTLRKNIMYEFLDRLCSVALPRTRDFRGISKKFDGNGNYCLGIKEQIIFPEIDIDKISQISGMDINIVTSTKSDEEGYELLLNLGLPFKK